MIRDMIARCDRFFATSDPVHSSEPLEVSEIQAAPETSPPLPEVAGTEPRKLPGKPPSEAMRKAVDLLACKPEVTAAELMNDTGVSRKYALTLLRRAKVTESAPAALQSVPRSKLSRPQTKLVAFGETLEELLNAVKEIQEKLPGAATDVDLNRRDRILGLLDGGKASAEIALTLRIPAGEVDFVSRVRLLLLPHA